MYIESKKAFIEVQFPEFGKTVIYSDNINHKLRN